MKPVATSNYEFRDLITNGYVYVDKTDLLAELALREGDAAYFIARPRRFGKSLMISTLECMFEGRRELFNGLKIQQTAFDWKVHPVIRLDMSELKAGTVEALEQNLQSAVDDIAKRFGISVKRDATPGKSLSNALGALAVSTGSKVVVLVDEYDVPLQGFLGSDQMNRAQTLLHDFYSAFKVNIGSIRFLMMTGVSKFAKMSVFSSLNNLVDLTMDDPRYAALLGYTHEEIDSYFTEQILGLAKGLGRTSAEIRQSIFDWYDSYRFCCNSDVTVVNPVALGMLIRFGQFGNYWSKTAMATLVYERLCAAGKSPFSLENIAATPDELDVCDAEELPYKALLYQTGYLTIKDVVRRGTADVELTLGVPNAEVRSTLRSEWFRQILGVESKTGDELCKLAWRQLDSGDAKGLVEQVLYAIFAKIPPQWRVKCEADAKRHFLLFADMIGGKARPEVPSMRGAADAIIEASNYVYVFEFKYDRSAKEALAQIADRGYADAYRADSRKVLMVGINFSSRARNVDEPLVEEFVK